MYAQRSFEDLGTPLAGVTFCVVDLETTGGSSEDTITEIGAIKLRRGETLGTFQTLVNPGRPVPAFIRLLTGINDGMLVEAPGIESVLPSFLEFVGGTVIVAHNARFDVSFLNAALVSASYPPLGNRVVDTAGLARKILSGEVPNNKLATLASYLRCAHRPCHRAFADVLATADVLHNLIERVAGFGVTTLEELLAISSTRMDGTFSKIEMTHDLPRRPGIYRFVGATGKTLYVGKATDVRARVRSYFYGDPRSRIRDLLREAQDVMAEPHASLLEAEVAEARAIAREAPPYNRSGRRRSNWYLKASLRTRVPKLSPARSPKDDGAIYFGPFNSLRVVRALLDALRDAVPLHRCSDPARCVSCPFADLGRCPGNDSDLHRSTVRTAVAGIVCDPSGLFLALERRMRTLAEAHRFEEAAEVRERGALLARAALRFAETTALLDAKEFVIAHEGRAYLIREGQLAAAGTAEGDVVARLRAAARWNPVRGFWAPEILAEARVILSWIRRNASALRLVHMRGTWALPVAGRPCERFHAR
ncbi:MAG TPA: DEDD exonuclease domain-containing protein [Actinomycetota bacterium]|nr:DEDD exonuclease domain-containing protein [Actinomycetota bacterium]